MKTLAGIAVFTLFLCALAAEAKVDLVTLPGRERVQVTIYNSADLTLVRESRALTLKKGLNRLQFAWAGTLIDPTSLEMLPKAEADRIEVFDLSYPPRTKNVGVWRIDSGVSGDVPMEITYLTSGLSWRAFYMGTLTAEETAMRLQGYVRVANGSGEDYENARTRLIVGKVNLLDRIADLARREVPYGRPSGPVPMATGAPGRVALGGEVRLEMARSMAVAEEAPKEIRKEGLSEYFLYTIEGTETIPDGWAKRLPSFEVEEVPVENLYKYEEERYGRSVVRFLSFKNDEDHELGETPIPGGMLKVYRSVDRAGRLSYEGQSSFQYIPVDEDVELNLGRVDNVTVEPTLMDMRSDRFLFDKDGDITGWIEVRTFKVKVANTRPVPVKVEVQRNFPTQYWDLELGGDEADYEKVDLDTVKMTLALAPRTTREFQYVLTTRHGERAE